MRSFFRRPLHCTASIRWFSNDLTSNNLFQNPLKMSETRVIKARGLPFSATAEEVLEFFSECSVVGGVDGINFGQNRYQWNRRDVTKRFRSLVMFIS